MGIDTVKEVIIQAYTSGRPIKETPAAIGTFNGSDLSRFNPVSILSAVNTIPGIRMEERSPGSYRFSIRGSLLRSPFGVRNVKVYLNGLPLTDAGGNTYINLIDNNSIQSAEIIKGPGGSLYGAGTGGVVLLNSPRNADPSIELSSSIGSYGLFRHQLSASFKAKKLNTTLRYSEQRYAGYRDQSEMKRHAFTGDFTFLLNEKNTISATLLFTSLYYQTPGGLNLAEYNDNARRARPAAGPFHSAADQKAAVKNNTPFTGLTFEHEWNSKWISRLSVVGAYSDFKNPAIRNYEARNETNAGLRNENLLDFQGKKISGRFTFGTELQQIISPVKVYGNRGGKRDTLQTNDLLRASIGSLFSQIDLTLSEKLILTLGGSLSSLKYNFERRYPGANVKQTKNFNPVFSPRIALLRKLTPNFSAYTNMSRGFSPPSLAEVRPSTNTFNSTLQSESGTNYEIGTRGNFKQLTFDLTAYLFNLNNTLVIRHDNTGADYFINAGKTRQKGIEAFVAWTIMSKPNSFISKLKIWSSYTLNNYHFVNYQSGDTDLSGNRVTGVPPVVVVSGIDIGVLKKLFISVTSNYTDHIALVDNNSIYAAEYYLFGSRLSYRSAIGKNVLEIFAGIDNAFDRKYSLGNDLNAAGGRYFNVAPGRNYYGGVNFKIGL
jgi:iron complex outermembrane receptor protein